MAEAVETSLSFLNQFHDYSNNGFTQEQYVCSNPMWSCVAQLPGGGVKSGQQLVNNVTTQSWSRLRFVLFSPFQCCARYKFVFSKLPQNVQGYLNDLNDLGKLTEAYYSGP